MAERLPVGTVLIARGSQTAIDEWGRRDRFAVVNGWGTQPEAVAKGQVFITELRQPLPEDGPFDPARVVVYGTGGTKDPSEVNDPVRYAATGNTVEKGQFIEGVRRDLIRQGSQDVDGIVTIAEGVWDGTIQ